MPGMRFAKLEPWLYLAPVVIGVVIVTGGAIVASFLLGFTDWDLIRPPGWIGLANYREMMGSDLFRTVLGNTLYFTALMVPTSVAGSLALALLINRKIRGITFFRTVFFFPVVTSMIAVAVVWSWLYNPEFGLINCCARFSGSRARPGSRVPPGRCRRSSS